jgi:hypothetical protein
VILGSLEGRHIRHEVTKIAQNNSEFIENIDLGLFFIYYVLRRSGTESIIAEASYWPIVPALDDK